VTELETLVDLPITPLGLAGIYLGEDVDAVVARIGEPEVRSPAPEDDEEGIETLEYGPFAVISRNGRVFALWALEGYRGETLGGIGIGMPWNALLRTAPGVAFDEQRYAWVVPGWPYLGIEVARPSREDEFDDEGPWTEEWYEVTDPDQTFVSLIAISVD
jgi:hypothetical protein